MVAYKHLLAPVDFSEASLHAARFAARLAARFGAKLTVAHAAAIDEPNVAERMAALDTEGHPADHRVLSGDPAEAVVRAAAQGVDLIVMATHGVGALRRFLLGSVAAKVLHDARCAVLTTTHQSDLPELGRKQFRHVVAAVDLGPASESVARAAAALGAPTTLLHVLPPDTLGGVAYYDPERWIAISATKLMRISDLPALVRTGQLQEVANQVIGEKNADLLVIGRHPHGLTGRLHDAAYTLIRESRVPVLSV